MTTISIAMAAYNGEQFLGEQLESYANQVRLPDELVITDDGSTDETVRIASDFAARAPFPVHVHRNPERLGFSRNFARALSLCQGDVLLISDQDDVWYPNKIATIWEAFISRPAMLALIHDENVADRQGQIAPETLMQLVRKAGMRDRYIAAGNCSAFRKQLLPLLLPVSDRANYDNWFALLSDLLEIRTILPQPLQVYRRHGSNATEPELLREIRPSFHLGNEGKVHEGWTREIELLREAIGRMRDRADLIGRLTGDLSRAEEAIRKAEMEIAHIETRWALLSRPRWRRAAAVVRLWHSGFYSAFAGRKSAIKDLVRPAMPPS